MADPTGASVLAKARYIGRSEKEIVDTAGMTDAEAAQFLGESEVALSRAPALVQPVAKPAPAARKKAAAK